MFFTVIFAATFSLGSNIFSKGFSCNAFFAIKRPVFAEFKVDHYKRLLNLQLQLHHQYDLRSFFDRPFYRPII